ncbi:MAG: chorismate-binding protein, partial [Bacteroidales bacterium]|nr:chorismate-binding protein [Candidatus Physcousia equi]
LTTGQLEHRCTDFRFRLPSPSASILRLARSLHPTPAVGGFPQKEAYEWLVQHEHLKRNYFSGYLGPISPQGESLLFVNLRSAQVTSLATYYYAGGGLTKDSVLADEVREIERKMDTLKKLNR